MAKLRLNKEQREAVEKAKSDGKTRMSIDLTDTQMKSLLQSQTNADIEKEEILSRGRAAKARARARKKTATSIGEKIRALREGAGLSLDQVASLTMMSKPAISKIETGVNDNPKIATIRKLAEAVGVEADVVFR